MEDGRAIGYFMDSKEQTRVVGPQHLGACLRALAKLHNLGYKHSGMCKNNWEANRNGKVYMREVGFMRKCTDQQVLKDKLDCMAYAVAGVLPRSSESYDRWVFSCFGHCGLERDSPNVRERGPLESDAQVESSQDMENEATVPASKAQAVSDRNTDGDSLIDEIMTGIVGNGGRTISDVEFYFRNKAAAGTIITKTRNEKHADPGYESTSETSAVGFPAQAKEGTTISDIENEETSDPGAAALTLEKSDTGSSTNAPEQTKLIGIANNEEISDSGVESVALEAPAISFPPKAGDAVTMVGAGKEETSDPEAEKLSSKASAISSPTEAGEGTTMVGVVNEETFDSGAETATSEKSVVFSPIKYNGRSTITGFGSAETLDSGDEISAPDASSIEAGESKAMERVTDQESLRSKAVEVAIQAAIVSSPTKFDEETDITEICSTGIVESSDGILASDTSFIEVGKKDVRGEFVDQGPSLKTEPIEVAAQADVVYSPPRLDEKIELMGESEKNTMEGVAGQGTLASEDDVEAADQTAVVSSLAKANEGIGSFGKGDQDIGEGDIGEGPIQPETVDLAADASVASSPTKFDRETGLMGQGKENVTEDTADQKPVEPEAVRVAAEALVQLKLTVKSD